MNISVRKYELLSAPVMDKMSSTKVLPTSESKSGKIYANSEQRQTLMAVYLADNYPDTSILEQVALEIRFELRQKFWPNQLRKIILLYAPGIQ